MCIKKRNHLLYTARLESEVTVSDTFISITNDSNAKNFCALCDAKNKHL